MSDPNPPIPSVDDILIRRERVAERLAALRRRHDKISESVSGAKAFLQVAPTIQEVLDAAQKRINDEIVGGLGLLLTHFLQGIMDDPDRAIACETEIDGRGIPQVSFQVVRHSGEREDILTGNGGSIANIVCTGLRLIAVHRAKRMRRLLVLDEPDCWLSPDRVPAFIGILQRTLEALPQPIQVLMITHHNVEGIGGVDTVDIGRFNGSLNVMANIRQKPSGDQIRTISLENWRSHAATTLPLGAGLTVLRGANNIGKSAIVEALRCLTYGGAKQDAVKHGETEARVCIEFCDGGRIELVRKRKANPSTIYRWLDREGSVLREEFGGRGASVPEWMKEALGIYEIEEQQVHISDQKKPVFLLDLPASRQTSMLSIQQEAQAITSIIDRFREMKRSAQQTARDGEIQLERLRRLFLAVSDAEMRLPAAEDLLAIVSQISRQTTDLSGMNKILANLRRLKAIPAMRMPDRIDAPAYTDTLPMKDMAQRGRSLRPAASMALPQGAVAPSCADTSTMRRLLEQIGRYSKVLTLRIPDAITLSEVHDARAMRNALDALRRLKEDGVSAKKQNESARIEYEKHLREIAKLESEIGACPLCGRAFAADPVHR